MFYENYYRGNAEGHNRRNCMSSTVDVALENGLRSKQT
jgi:hypothetical protein